MGKHHPRKSIPAVIIKRVCGKQHYKCANKSGNLPGLGGYECPLWKIEGESKGSFDGVGFQIDHIIEHCLTQDDSEENLQALCISCHTMKTALFLHNRKKSALKDKALDEANDESDDESENYSKYVCHRCHYATNSARDFENHKNRKIKCKVNKPHKGIKIKKTYCNFCDRNFSSPQALKNHINTRHSHLINK